jgi:hypothetical protein
MTWASESCVTGALLSWLPHPYLVYGGYRWPLAGQAVGRRAAHHGSPGAQWDTITGFAIHHVRAQDAIRHRDLRVKRAPY